MFVHDDSHDVMPGFMPGIHVLLHSQDVDARDKRGHDEAKLHGIDIHYLRGLSSSGTA
jgi:hypothetical protein